MAINRREKRHRIIENIRLTTEPSLILLYTLNPLVAFAIYQDYTIDTSASNLPWTIILASIIILLLLPFGASAAERPRLRSLGYEICWTTTASLVFCAFCFLAAALVAAMTSYWVDTVPLSVRCSVAWILFVLFTMGPIWVLAEPVNSR